MTDYREELFQSFCNTLVEKGYDPGTINDVSGILINKLSNYEIAERCTELAVIERESEQLVKWFIGTLYTEHKSSRTLEEYQKEIMKFYRFIAKPLKDANVMDIRCYLSNELQRVSETTVENKRSYLSSFYKFLVREDIIVKNPMDKIQPIKHQTSNEQAFTEVEIDKIRNACSSVRNRALVELAYSSGLRASEICELKISDVDFRTLEVIVRHGKGDKYRVAFISPLCASYLKKYLSTRKENSDFLLVTRNSTQLDNKDICKIMQKIGKISGVDNVHCHRFRKTLGSILAQRGVDSNIIKEILGHESVETTVKYYIKNNHKHIRSEYDKAM